MSGPAYRHTCLFALHGPLEPWLLDGLEAYAVRFRADFPTIRRYRFDRNRSRKAGGYALVLYSEFDDEAAFRAYVASPLHDEIVRFMAPHVAQTLFADLVC